MSQAGVINSTGMPTVPTTFVTDSGNAIPALNILNVVTPGSGSNGITTSGSGNTITITLNGVTENTAQTIGAVTADVVTLNLGATPTTYIVEAKIAGFEATGPSGIGYNLICVVKTNGAAATIISTQDKYVAEVAPLLGADGNFVVSGNNLIVRVLGVAGFTINWKASTTSLGV